MHPESASSSPEQQHIRLRSRSISKDQHSPFMPKQRTKSLSKGVHHPTTIHVENEGLYIYKNRFSNNSFSY